MVSSGSPLPEDFGLLTGVATPFTGSSMKVSVRLAVVMVMMWSVSVLTPLAPLGPGFRPAAVVDIVSLGLEKIARMMRMMMMCE